MTPVMITLLAEEPANTGPDFGKASPVGLLVVVLLLIGVFLLARSMNRHLRKVPASFGTPAADDGAPGADTKAGLADTTGAAQSAPTPDVVRPADTGEPSHEPGG